MFKYRLFCSFVVSEFRCLIFIPAENCSLPAFTASSSGNVLPAFKDNILAPSSRVNKKYIFYQNRLEVGRDNVVGNATRYRLDGPGIESR